MKRVICFLIRAYQVVVSPLLPRCCRFEPTCSCYALKSVERFGCVRGLWYALGRVVRCHPFGGAGYDPVPDRPARSVERPSR